MGMDKLRISFFSFLIAILTAATLAAQGFDYSSIGIDVLVDPAEVSQGGFGVVKITYEIPFAFTVTDNPSVFSIEPVGIGGVSFGALQKPQHDHEDDVGGHWGGLAAFKFFFTIARDAQPGQRELKFNLTIQACDEETGTCYRPFKTTVTGTLVVTGDATAAVEEELPEGQPEETETTQAAAELEESRPADESPDEEEVITVEEQAGPPPAVAPLEESLKNWLDETLTGGQIWLAFLIVFAAGILTSLTPCVYPMIPITISYVSGRAQGKKKNGFFISLVLVLGMAIMYTVLGVIAAQTGATFGAFGQNIWVQLVVFVILVLMGFSMLGAFEIGLPSSLQQKISVQRSGYIGALGIGLTIGLVAAPCVAPVLIPILALIAGTGSLFLGVTLMLVYALGMGVLFVLVGTFSNIILPRSGEWMVWLKKVFAFVLFLVAIFFAQGLFKSIPIPYLFEFSLGSVLVLFGTVIGAFYRLEKDAGWWMTLGKAAGLLLVTAGLIFFALGFLKPILPTFTVGTAGGSGISTPSWVKDYESGMGQARAEGKPVLVDFWAEWCAACHELDNYTFSDPRVLQELRRFVAIKIDGTNEDEPAYQKTRERYDVQALPRVVIHGSDGRVARFFDGFRDADTVLAYLKEVR